MVLSTFADTHFEFAKKSMESGKHVICEKPFVPTSVDAQGLIDISEKTGKKLIVYQNRRYDADFNTISHILKNEKSLQLFRWTLMFCLYMLTYQISGYKFSYHSLRTIPSITLLDGSVYLGAFWMHGIS